MLRAILAIEAEAMDIVRAKVSALDKYEAARPIGCTHHCEGGHYDGDDMTMNEQHGWSLRDRGLGLDGEPLEAAGG
jgi:hypothetical protein